jgi:hypothetical protein
MPRRAGKLRPTKQALVLSGQNPHNSVSVPPFLVLRSPHFLQKRCGVEERRGPAW